MNDDAQILIARLLTHQTLRRDDKMVKRALSDDQFRAELDKRLLESGLKLLDNVYADHVTLALHRTVEPKIFGAKDIWQNNNFGLTRDGVALLVVLWAQIILPKRERQETHTIVDDQSDMFDKDNPIPRAEDASIGISYTALLADFGDKLGKKTRMDMNLGVLSKLGFIERRGDVILEGPLLDLMMDTDLLKERIVNGALSEVFKRAPLAIASPRRSANDPAAGEPVAIDPAADAAAGAAVANDVVADAPVAAAPVSAAPVANDPLSGSPVAEMPVAEAPDADIPADAPAGPDDATDIQN
jgi:hypothetical protein